MQVQIRHISFQYFSPVRERRKTKPKANLKEGIRKPLHTLIGKSKGRYQKIALKNSVIKEWPHTFLKNLNGLLTPEEL
jgi:hypothetical protein